MNGCLNPRVVLGTGNACIPALLWFQSLPRWNGVLFWQAKVFGSSQTHLGSMQAKSSQPGVSSHQEDSGGGKQEGPFQGLSHNNTTFASKLFQAFADSFGPNAGKRRPIWW